jgi:hypothetical protein
VATKPATLAIRVDYDGPVGRETLAGLDAELAAHPDALDTRFARACLLEELGRLSAARGAYRSVIARNARHFGALTNLGTMHFLAGERPMALVLYRQAAAHHPDQPAAWVNLGNALAEDGDAAAARAAYERALALAPHHPTAHFALALLLEARGEEAAAAAHRATAFREPILRTAPHSGSGPPIRVLQLVAAHGGNLVTSLFFDPQTVELTTLVVETARAGMALPPRDLVFNAIADADRNGDALERAAAVVRAAGRPTINAPERIAATARSATAGRLADIPGVVAPRTLRLRRAELTPAALTGHGLTFPLLVRAAGHHMGEHFERVDQPADLASVRDRLPGDVFYAIAFVDGRGVDGKFRKFRALFVDGDVYPLHLAIAPQWKVHYFSAEMRDSVAHRAEESSYLGDMAGHIGPAAMRALAAIATALGLEYAGIDFGIDAAGNVLVYEANATMAFYYPDDDPRFAYRVPAVDRVRRAVQTLIAGRALDAGALKLNRV